MVRQWISRVREWIAVEDPEERIEGSGEPITSPQHRRSADADELLSETDEHRERES
ncbi:hypothetical protein [Salinadaptatus halalkaliphilus]|uniref:hypothetical protein n=1 Tax=Salinadaptatus halalkaliphilus TaxID=2419781 RepID=UPI0015805F23|nr:hypothetical protein [Salinadaptatus halalkaliphilus]